MVQSSKAASIPPPEGMMRSTYMLGTLGFGYSAWAVFLAGLAAIHGALYLTCPRGAHIVFPAFLGLQPSSPSRSTQNSYITQFDSFAFGWLLACGFLALWVAIMLSWLRGTMASASRVLTPIIAILLSWFGIKTHEVIKLLLIAFKKNTMQGRFLVWAIGCIACGVCLGAMLIIVASWEYPADELSMIKAFRNSRGPRYMNPGGTTGAMTGFHSGMPNPGGESDNMCTPYGNIPHGSPFGDTFGQDPYQESAGLSNSAAQSGAEVTLNLNRKNAL